MGNSSSNYNTKDVDINTDKERSFDVTIMYCGGWGYGNNAYGLKEAIHEFYPKANIELERDNGITGRFEVVVNGKVVHSKKGGDGFVKNLGSLIQKIKQTIEV